MEARRRKVQRRAPCVYTPSPKSQEDLQINHLGLCTVLSGQNRLSLPPFLGLVNSRSFQTQLQETVRTNLKGGGVRKEAGFKISLL